MPMAFTGTSRLVWISIQFFFTAGLIAILISPSRIVFDVFWGTSSCRARLRRRACLAAITLPYVGLASHREHLRRRSLERTAVYTFGATFPGGRFGRRGRLMSLYGCRKCLVERLHQSIQGRLAGYRFLRADDDSAKSSESFPIRRTDDLPERIQTDACEVG